MQTPKETSLPTSRLNDSPSSFPRLLYPSTLLFIAIDDSVLIHSIDHTDRSIPFPSQLGLIAPVFIKDKWFDSLFLQVQNLKGVAI